MYGAVVFLGSEKYPTENGFDVFLKQHGGSSNAYTDCERVSTWALDCIVALGVASDLPFAHYKK